MAETALPVFENVMRRQKAKQSFRWFPNVDLLSMPFPAIVSLTG